ncbi:hypothetical protein CECT5772_01336 [Streptococcus equi subsp. ruminatorum CECT 5772]|uniref:Uncharacterized protein n=1 Tax=Streptococcus equi subsp. ruminatorum CECT 5772 TaxID=1051981 RepID=A0A922NW02_9STRE|nr:hypothetical protein CECT5772_01336 [Streptococcus equi subsp. ruminatorum CECT 5772]
MSSHKISYASLKETRSIAFASKPFVHKETIKLNPAAISQLNRQTNKQLYYSYYNGKPSK